MDIDESVAGSKTREIIATFLQEQTAPLKQILLEQNALLARVLDSLSVLDFPDVFEVISFQSDTLGIPGSNQYWIVPDYIRNHLMFLVTNGGVIYYQVPGMTIANKSTSTQGWYQVDLPPGTIISSNNNKSVVAKWSNYAHGMQF
jgi:hypothetical protein